MINEDAPTNSVRTGAETSLPPAWEPGVTRLTRKKPIKRRRYAMSTSDMLKTEGAQKDTSFLPFLISYDGAEQYVLYGKSESQIKIELRRIYRPENFKRIIHLMETGEVDTNPWITHRATYDQFIGQFPKWLTPEAGVVKAMLEF